MFIVKESEMLYLPKKKITDWKGNISENKKEKYNIKKKLLVILKISLKRDI